VHVPGHCSRTIQRIRQVYFREKLPYLASYTGLFEPIFDGFDKGFSIFLAEKGWLGGAAGRGTYNDGAYIDPCSWSLVSGGGRGAEEE
jgi:hypothetical protein